jgi:hypothetical protein
LRSAKQNIEPATLIGGHWEVSVVPLLASTGRSDACGTPSAEHYHNGQTKPVNASRQPQGAAMK